MTGFPLTTASAAEWSRELKNKDLSIFDVLSYFWYFQILDRAPFEGEETSEKNVVSNFITSTMGLGVSMISQASAAKIDLIQKFRSLLE